LYADKGPTALTLANFLDLNQPTFYRSLLRLHSVLNIPSAAQAHDRPIRVYHASFSDFLKDTSRSGPFSTIEAAVHNDVATQSLPWLYWTDPGIFELTFEIIAVPMLTKILSSDLAGTQMDFDAAKQRRSPRFSEKVFNVVLLEGFPQGAGRLHRHVYQGIGKLRF
jgi:hypothetical protein